MSSIRISQSFKAAIFFGTACIASDFTHAQTCDPYKLTIKMSLFPHPSQNLPNPTIYIAPRWGACGTDAASAGDSYFVSHQLDKTLSNSQSLQAKCAGLVSALRQDPDQRFEIISACAAGQSTISLRHIACSGKSPLAGKSGLSVLMANSPQALKNFVSGQILPDYERDTIIPDCTPQELGRSESSNMLMLNGQATGTSFLDSNPSTIEVKISDMQGVGTISATIHPAANQSIESVVAQLVSNLNITLDLAGDTAVCTQDTINGKIMSCLRPDQSSASADLSFSSTDTGVTKGAAGGDPLGIQEIVVAARGNTCSDITSNCVIGGQTLRTLAAISSSGDVPIPFWALGLLAAGLGSAGRKILSRK